MIKSVGFMDKISSSYSRLKNTQNKILARTHNINFLKEENKFYDSAERAGKYADDASMKAIPEFFVSIKHFGKMIGEKLKSLYYSQK